MKKNPKKTVFWIILAVVILLVIAAVVFLMSSRNRIVKDPSLVTSIRVFDGTTGHGLTITDRDDIDAIVGYANLMKLKPYKVSAGYSGYRFSITFEPSTGSWDSFILNSPLIVRNDPFFYAANPPTGLYVYLESLFDEQFGNGANDTGS